MATSDFTEQINAIRKAVRCDDLEDALDGLERLVEGSDTPTELRDAVIECQRGQANLRKRIHDRSVDDDQARTEQTRISKQILELVNKLEAHAQTTPRTLIPTRRPRVIESRGRSPVEFANTRQDLTILDEPGTSPTSYGGYEVDLEGFHRWPGWVYCGPMRDAKRRTFSIQDGDGDPSYFYDGPEFARLVDLIREGRHVVVSGKPKSGKTRLAFEALRRIEDIWLLYLQPGGEYLQTAAGDEIPRLPEGLLRAVLFYDDLEKYHKSQDPERMVRSLDPNRVSVVATVRSNLEYDRARRIFRQAVTKLDPVMIKPIELTIGLQVADRAKITDPWQDGFDGTIGSVVLGSKGKEEIYESWDHRELPRVILRVCKLLRMCGTYEYRLDEARLLCADVFGVATHDDETWRSALRALEGGNFLLGDLDQVSLTGVLRIYDADLDQLIPTRDIPFDRDRLVSLVTSWSSRERFSELQALAVPYRWDVDYRRLIFDAIERCIKSQDRAIYHHLLASMLTVSPGFKDEEIRHRKAAADLEPTRGVWAYLLGNRLAQLNDGEAEKWLRIATDVEPNSSWIEEFGDFLRTVGGRDEEAMQCYERALALDDNNDSARFSLACLLACQSKRLEEACDLAVRAIQSRTWFLLVLHDRLPIPNSLAQMQRWRDAWLDYQVWLSVNFVLLDDGVFWPNEELKRAIKDDWIHAKALLHRLENAWDDKLGENGEANNAAALSQSLEEIVRSFYADEALQVITSSALDRLRNLSECFPNDERIADSRIKALAFLALTATAADAIKTLDDEVNVLVKENGISTGLPENWGLFRRALVSSYARLGLSEEVDNQVSQLSEAAESHVEEPAFRHYFADALVELLEHEERRGNGGAYLEHLERLSATFPGEPGLRQSWATGLASFLWQVCDDNEIQELERRLEQLKELVSQHQHEIPLLKDLARGLAASTHAFGKANRITDMQRCLATLHRLGKVPFDDHRVRTTVRLQLIGGVADAIEAYAEANRLADVEKSLRFLNQEATEEAPEQVHYARARGLSSASWVFHKAKRYTDSEACLSDLSILCEKHPTIDDLPYVYVAALHDAVNLNAQDKRLRDVSNRLTQLEKLVVHRDDAGMRELWVGALRNAIWAYAEEKQIDDVEACLKRLENTVKKHDEPSSREALADGLSAAAWRYGQDKRVERAEDCIRRLERLANEHVDNTTIHELWANSISNAIWNCDGFEQVGPWVNRLELLANQHQTATIRQAWAQSMGASIVICGNSGRYDQIELLLGRLQTLVRNSAAEHSLRNEYCRAVANASWVSQSADNCKLLDAINVSAEQISNQLAGNPRALQSHLYCLIARVNIAQFSILTGAREPDRSVARQLSNELYELSHHPDIDDDKDWAISTAAEGMLLCDDGQTARKWFEESLGFPTNNDEEEIPYAAAVALSGDLDSAGHIVQTFLPKIDRLRSLQLYLRHWCFLWPEEANCDTRITAIKTSIQDRISELHPKNI